MLPSLNEEEDSQLPPRRSSTGRRSSKTFTLNHSVPINWTNYWEHSRDVEIPTRKAVFRVYETGNEQKPHLLCVHGGGYTALTWSLLVSRLKDRFRVTAFDLRGHGNTKTENDLDLSANTLTEDVIALWNTIRERNDDQSPLVLIGHSMGGAIAVRAAATGRMASLEGVVVIDVVEGTATASLPFMKTVLQKRPESFTDLIAAVQWALSTKMNRNEESACISIPSMLIESGSEWKWRTPLVESEPYWSEWYQGLSSLFLNLPVPKMLCLAGTDRLDKDLTVGQMQGKFQLVLLPTSGHAIHEDEPDHIQQFLQRFVDNFRIGQSPLPFVNKQR